MKNYNLQLTREEKIERLAMYLNGYIDECISQYTNNSTKLEETLEDNTIMYLLNEWYNCKTARLNNIKVTLKNPFECEFHTYNKETEIGHILYELIIKEDS